MGERIAAFDWSTTPLGPIDRWPQSLRTVVNILLTSRYAMWMAWGSDLTMLYNDAYSPTLGIKHPKPWELPPAASGRKSGPTSDRASRPCSPPARPPTMKGSSYFWSAAAFPKKPTTPSPTARLANDHGRINGMLCVVTEETDRLHR